MGMMMDATIKAPPLAVVRPDWVDGYGHMNMGYYLVVFDMVTDQLWPTLGLGAPLHAQGRGTFAMEFSHFEKKAKARN